MTTSSLQKMDKEKQHNKSFSQRYTLEPPMLFPFVNQGFAQEFGAFVVSLEFRFYGKSQPVQDATTQQLVQYLTPYQALADSIASIEMIREGLGCSKDKTSNHYCPVMTFEVSYPGFLSSMMRFVYPDVGRYFLCIQCTTPDLLATGRPQCVF